MCSRFIMFYYIMTIKDDRNTFLHYSFLWFKKVVAWFMVITCDLICPFLFLFHSRLSTLIQSSIIMGPSWLWSYGSWIYNYLCNHWCCEFESRLGRGVQHYEIKFESDLTQVGGFPPPIKLTATILLKYCWKWR